MKECKEFTDGICVKNCCNIRANEFWTDGYGQAHIDHPSVGQCEVEKLIGEAVEKAKAQQWQLDQEHATTLEGQIESLQADIARLEKQYEDSEKFLNREAAFEEQRLHEEVKYWKDKNYRLG
uniref:Uncharacterized protein n=2 Tax=viral metagenome TaxID=1070528 RepID=A0A6M3IQ45_9ZZZZ